MGVVLSWSYVTARYYKIDGFDLNADGVAALFVCLA
jgi:hypothetical protein